MMQKEGYLFIHFRGESEEGEQIYFAISQDGLHWEDLKEGKPVLLSGIGEKGVRDPFIIRSPKEEKYYIIATDLRIANEKGWQTAQYTGSRNIIIWESSDLIHWSKERSCEVGIPGAGCVWAPEAIYDEEKKAFFVFWASMVKEDGEQEAKQRIYASYTEDFIRFTNPEKYMERENHVIDTTIIKEGSYYYRFYKDETSKNICMDRSISLEKDSFSQVDSTALSELSGVEGPIIFWLADKEEWCLLVDQYAIEGGYLPLVTKDLSSGKFQIMEQEEYYMGKKKRHGTVISLSVLEYERLREVYGRKNPVIEGLYADPDIAKFNDTYYIYPTSDGFVNWSGSKFKAFSSENLIDWKDEGILLDLNSNQVPWAVGCAWAPAIAERNGKYYFYFCGKREDGISCIGCAVAETPVGPFTAGLKPLLSPEMLQGTGVEVSQVIDPSIYEEDGNYYLLFGNGAGAIVRLEDNMMDICIETMKNIDGLKDFREAVTVIKRNDKYHFTWSCDDTGSEDYHVNYGTADTLYGPVVLHHTILSKRIEKNVLGTGHHSIYKVPKENRYLIAYHRFATPLEKYPEGKGFHREVCLGEVTFDAEGYMNIVEI
ncbi:MAG: family 43 glycosylhydrolase [Mobilitalea sp.]